MSDTTINDEQLNQAEENIQENSDDDTVTSADPRHQRRIDQMQLLFARTFDNGQFKQDQTEPNPNNDVVDAIIEKVPELDEQIQAVAPERPLKDINKIDLAILRLIMFESLEKKTPKKVLINEAVELAKQFGTETSPKFVNGVLGKLLMSQQETEGAV